VRFVDFLKTTVLLSAGSATILAALTVVGASHGGHPAVALGSIGWWLAASVLGLVIGRRSEANPPIARLLAGARTTSSLPEPRPNLILLNRLWPLMLVTLGAAGLSVLAPQVPGIVAGLPIILALSWRRQEAAVAAIEERDGVQFHVERTSPVRPMVLLRSTGFRAVRPQQLSDSV